MAARPHRRISEGGRAEPQRDGSIAGNIADAPCEHADSVPGAGAWAPQSPLDGRSGFDPVSGGGCRSIAALRGFGVAKLCALVQ